MPDISESISILSFEDIIGSGFSSSGFVTLNVGFGIVTLTPLFMVWLKFGFFITVEIGDELPLAGELESFVLIVLPSSADLTSFFVGACAAAARNL